MYEEDRVVNEIITLEQAALIMRSAMREAMKRHSKWYIGQGALMMAAGIVGLLFPVISSLAVIYILGWLVIASGVLQAISLIGARYVPHFWLQLVASALSLVIGLLLIRNPGGGLVALTLLMIVFFIVGGIAKVVLALTLRPFPKWSWILASGVIGIVLGVVLFAEFRAMAPWLLGFLVGIQLFSEGGAFLYLAWHARKDEAA